MHISFRSVPQVVFQWLYYSVANLTPTLVFASSSSFLTILIAVILWCIERDDDSEPLQYYLAVERTGSSVGHKPSDSTMSTLSVDTSDTVSSANLSSLERHKIEYHRGFGKQLSRSLTRFWGIPDNSIKIGSTITTKSGAITHIVHSMATDDAEDFAAELFGDDFNAKMGLNPLVTVRRFYELKQPEISQLFRDHFQLGAGFQVTFYDSTDRRKLTVSLRHSALSKESSGGDGGYHMMNEDSGL